MILVISDLWLPFPGGAERLIFNLARDLMRRGEDVQVLTSYANAQQFDGPPVEFRSIGVELFRADGARDLAQYIEETKPSVILTHHYFAFEFQAELVASGVPLVQVVLNGRRIPEAALALFISEFVRSRPGMNPQAHDLTMIPPAFDDVIATRHGDAIGFIKPLHHKGVDLVYEIARRLPRRKFLVLRGEWQDIETIVDLPNVEYMEPVDDIRAFYERCRMILMPSLSEDAGTVAQEAALNCLPCISSAVGGLSETNRGGVQVVSRDPAVWVAEILMLDDEEGRLWVIDRQRAALDDARHVELLDAFAYRVGVVAARGQM